MNIIVAVSSNWGIGKNNGLLFNIPEDMKFFREMTMNKVVVMGRKTLESFPQKKPLPKRTNIVLSRNADFAPDGVLVCHSIEALFKELKKYDTEDIFIIGGEQIYREMIPFCSRAYITQVEHEADADSFLPDFTKLHSWELEDISPKLSDNGYTFTFNVYKNNAVVPF